MADRQATHPRGVRQDSTDDSTIIVARWAGKCADCSLGFARGDRIRWRRGHAAHLDCEAARAQLMARCDELIAAASGRREDQR